MRLSATNFIQILEPKIWLEITNSYKIGVMSVKYSALNIAFTPEIEVDFLVAFVFTS